ncbi:MAG: acetate--CoA ligase [Chloroflexi bacterium]|nr:MAG: acetate--CoA ligase [Chloroflexota bacterium]
MSDVTPGGHAIETLQVEERRYKPDPAFSKQANAKPGIYKKGFDEFWTEESKRISFFEPWNQLYEWKPPYAKWFVGGKLNICYNCVDRHVDSGHKDKVAYFWEGEPEEDRREITFGQLQKDVVRFANALKKLGVKKGTHVGIYMGMIPELPVAMLACTRIGAPFTVVFGGYAALEASPTVTRCVVVRRTGGDVHMLQGRDVWAHDVLQDVRDDPETCACEPMDSEDLLYLLYTSGTTAKPKGIIHTTAGYLVGVASTHHYIFDVKPSSIYWCAADIGWVTGHSYIVFGPLANATTGIIYEGTPDFPDKDRWWKIVERYKPDILYTAPTTIRTHMKWGPEYAQRYDLSSLRVLGTVGEPINPEAWVWYREHVGGNRTPVVDTWWQTETGMILITPLPGITTLKPGSATQPFPTVDAAVYNNAGETVPPGGGGYLVIRKPWPAMLRGIYGDPERYQQTYWSRWKDTYFVGDGARVDEDGDFWLLGRVDDVMNVSGHRISTIEVESALVSHPAVAEAAVAGRNDAQTGQAIVAFVTLKGGKDGSPKMLKELRDHVGKVIGKFAAPANIVFTPELPKTRSGKIMRRLLRDVSENRPLGDTTTLADPAVVAELARRGKEEASKEES